MDRGGGIALGVEVGDVALNRPVVELAGVGDLGVPEEALDVGVVLTAGASVDAGQHDLQPGVQIVPYYAPGGRMCRM